MENEDKERKRFLLDEDLMFSLVGAGLGYLFGKMGSWVNPLGIPKGIKNISEGGIKDLTDFAYNAAGALGYGVGYYNIINNLAQDPSDANNYVPVAINAVAAALEAGTWLYNRGKKKGLEARISSA